MAVCHSDPVLQERSIQDAQTFQRPHKSDIVDILAQFEYTYKHANSTHIV